MKFVGVDCETHLLPPSGTEKVNLYHHVPDLVCVTFSRTGEAFGPLEGSKAVWFKGLLRWDQAAEIEQLFRGVADDTYFVFHNAAFDLAVLSRAHPHLRGLLEELCYDGRILDTRVMYLLRCPDPTNRRVTLAHLAKRLLRVDLDKGSVRTSFRRGQEFTDAQRQYAIEDADVTRRIAEVLRRIPYGGYSDRHAAPQQRVIAAHPVSQVSDPDRLYSTAAALLAWHLVPMGMAVDRLKLQDIGDTLRREHEMLTHELYNFGFVRVVRKPKAPTTPITITTAQKFSGLGPLTRSWQPTRESPLSVMIRREKGQVQTVPAKVTVNENEVRFAFQEWASEHGIDAPISGKTQGISLKRDDWKDYERELPPALQTYLAYQKVSKYLSAFIRPLEESCAEHVHPNYFIPGAATGRWACSKPNLQQVPKKHGMRSIYRAPHRKKFVLADYPTLELYTLAHTMAAMGIRGPLMEKLGSTDVHVSTAALMYSKPETEISAEERFAAKACNFGLPGGMGARRFHRHLHTLGLDISMQDAADMRDRWFAAYPDVRKYLNNFNVNPYRHLKPPDKEAEEWLRDLGFDPDDTWPNRFELTRRVNDGKIYTVVLPTGRVVPERTYSMAANCFFQGLGADVITEAFVRVCRAALVPAAVVHDSITVVTDSDPDAVGLALVGCMADALQCVCPTTPRAAIQYEVSEVWK